MALKSFLTQKQLQRLSPQQIQFIKLLELPVTDLDARILEELESNPALESEESTGEDPQDIQKHLFNLTTGAINDPIPDLEDRKPEGQEEINHETNIEEHISHDDYSYREQLPDDPNEERYEAPIV
ncbi:MAG: hypothetical protein NZ108_03775, partial [Bacteroidia bacterium]|nr:hypothetical protein [Bacteroidia bacterium]